SFEVGQHSRISRKKEPAVREARQRARFTRAPRFVHLLEFPALFSALKKRPAAVVQGLGLFERLQAAGEKLFSDPYQAGGAAAPERPGAVVGRFVTVNVLLDFHD